SSQRTYSGIQQLQAILLARSGQTPEGNDFCVSPLPQYSNMSSAAKRPASGGCPRLQPLSSARGGSRRGTLASDRPADCAASPLSASPSSCAADSSDLVGESLASSRALSVYFGYALVSSLDLTVDANVLTYSCPERRMISYMISSVTDR